MGIESQQSRQPALARRGFHRAGDHRLMAHVDAVEDAEREMQRHAERGQVFKAVSNQHLAGIAVRRSHFKPYARAVPLFCRAAVRGSTGRAA